MITNIEILKRDLPRIHNIKNFLVTPEKYHPDNPRYIKQWNNYKKHCIEGIWIYDEIGWRYMPATLFYYGNFFKLEDQIGKQRMYIKPLVRDVDWIIHYSYLINLGFSGFKSDDVYSCDKALIETDTYNLLKTSSSESDRERFYDLYNTKGQLKEYKDPREYLKNLHTDNYGKCLYHNQSSNLMLFGSRGGGKSYSIAGICCQTLSFDGMKYYSQDVINKKPKVNISIGAGITDKSSELIDKIVTNLNRHGTDPDFGAWGTAGQPDFIPGPFYVDWVGSTKPNNAMNPFRYEYRVETPAGWQTEGSGTKMVHVNYSDKKSAGSQAAAGSRNALNIYTEIGLMSNFKDALLSNEATVSKDQERFGVQLADGTSGNIDLVQQTRVVFNDPETYAFLSFENIWEPTEHKIGLFLPAYLTNGKFKDQNGNTNIEEALKFFEQRRKEAASKDDPEVLRNEKMNYPLVPSDMWVSTKGSYFPVVELVERQQKVINSQSYKKNAKPVTLVWDSSSKKGVKSIPNPNAEPYYTYPFDKTMSKPDGSFVIYEEPVEIDHMIKPDQYIYTLDPYVSENIDEGGSIGAFQVWLNPKYLKDTGHKGLLMATYYGKNPDGKDAFYEIIEKGIQYYGNCPRMLWYEANRGDSVRGYCIRKNKIQLLAIRPTREKGSSSKERLVTEYGYMVGNKIDKLELCTDGAELLLTNFLFNGNQQRLLETLDDNFLIDQLIQFTFEGNFDATSAYLGYPLALKEIQHTFNKEAEKKERKNPLSFISMNPNIFIHAERTRK